MAKKLRKDREPIGKAIKMSKGRQLDDQSALALDILDNKGHFVEPEGPEEAWSLIDINEEEE